MIYSASNEVIDPKTGLFITFTRQQRVYIYLHLIVGYLKLQRGWWSSLTYPNLLHQEVLYPTH